MFGPAILTTATLVAIFVNWFSAGGFWWLEWVLISLIALTFFWISLSVGTATLGMVILMRAKEASAAAPPARQGMSVALLMPVYNEDPAEVLGNAAAMVMALDNEATRHRFDLFILSDTRDLATALEEERAVAELRALLPEGRAVWYRRRLQNSKGKVGNIGQWLRTWGGAYEAMIVLDADSLMSSEALLRLCDEMVADPKLGLVQTAPMIISSATLFGRIQQFSSCLYGALLNLGLAAWAGTEANYWGHNAIIRTRAFADCAGLPRVPSLFGRGSHILSHDFVEAALLRRAGWAVRFIPTIQGSFEEAPLTLVDYTRRDRRWCHGNLQHLALLGTKGLHPVSRFHLLNGAVSYLLSPAWFALLLIWALHGNGPESAITYFSTENPLYPIWPDMTPINSLLMMICMYGMLLATKFMGVMALFVSGRSLAEFGGAKRFYVSLIAELLLSILYAPIMMVQQMVAVFRFVVGIAAVWSPQVRTGGSYGLGTLLRFHALETVSGILLFAGMVAGGVSLWLLPIAISLTAAVPLSFLSGLRLSGQGSLQHLMETPEMLDPLPVRKSAQILRLGFEGSYGPQLAAE